MTVERYIRLMAGFFILLSLALGVEASPIFHSPWWLAFTAFVGFNRTHSRTYRWLGGITHAVALARHAGR